MNQKTGDNCVETARLHWREWLAPIVGKLKRLPPDTQKQMLGEPISIPLSQLMV
jgi:hypothetical protein